MKKIITILGARPQFVKAAVLSRVIQNANHIEEVIIHTGQHFDKNMSDIFFEEMNIPKAKYNLDINSMSHGAMTGLMLKEIEEVLNIEKPDAVVVYGDTNSTIAGALAAKKMGIKVVHIEAGLRSFNMSMPEEINRILTDRISDLLCCPTEAAITNLNNEGFQNLPNKIVKSGDIMKDAVEYYSLTSESKSVIIKQNKLKSNNFILATVHRQENTDDLDRLTSIFEALEEISKDVEVVLPLHPRTKNVLDKNGLNYDITFIDPVGYFDMLELLKHAQLVMTDSGGLQKEAFFSKKPCVILRDETEWVELVEHKFAQLTGADKMKILNAVTDLKTKKYDFEMNLFGDNVGNNIYQEILTVLG